MSGRAPCAARRWARKAAPPLAGLVLVATAAGRTGPLVLVNESASLPRGLYLRVPGAPAVRGSVVALAQPPAARAYLAGLGMPAEVRLLKRVAAIEGDPVCNRGGALVLPGRRAVALRADGRGTRLPAWRGCRRLARGEVFVLGDTPRSFDSRYFGPVRRARLDGVFRQAAQW